MHFMTLFLTTLTLYFLSLAEMSLIVYTTRALLVCEPCNFFCKRGWNMHSHDIKDLPG
jgi:hypothetical protein